MSHSKLIGSLGGFRQSLALNESLLDNMGESKDRPAKELELWQEVAKSVNTLRDEAGPRRTSGSIPAGFTYLLQFLAHDLFQHQKIPGCNPGGCLGGFTNLRRSPLMLETIYQHGIDTAPILYESAEEYGLPPAGFFELSPLPQNECPDLQENKDLDFRRLAAEVAGDLQLCKLGVLRYPKPRRAAVADARNDSHFLIAQITIAWMRFHNAILRRLYDENNKIPFPRWIKERCPSPGVVADARFRMAQFVARKSFHQILKKQIVKTFCGQEAGDFNLDDESVRKSGLLGDSAAFGTFRVFHSFPQNEYSLNKKMKFDLVRMLNIGSHSRNAAIFPDWEMAWENFFDLCGNGSAGNRTALRLGVVGQLKTNLDSHGAGDVFTNAVDYLRAGETGAYADDKFHKVFDNELPQFLRKNKKEESFQALFQNGSAPISGEALALLTKQTPIPLMLQLEACYPPDWAPGAGNNPSGVGNFGPVGAKLFAIPLLHRLAEAENRNSDFFDEAESMVVEKFEDLLRIAYELPTQITSAKNNGDFENG